MSPPPPPVVPLPQTRPGTRSRAARTLLPLLLLLLVLRLVLAGTLPLMDTTEARYAEIARKMAEIGDWITPWHEPGVPFWAKPPLSFWLTAWSFKLFGVSEFSARLPHLLCSLAVAALTGDLARRVLGATAGRRALALLGGSLMFVVASGAVMTDEVLLLCITAALHAFWCALHAPGRAATYGRWGFFVALGLGLLAKGPLAPVLVLIQVLPWAALSGRLRDAVARLPWLRGLALMLLLAAPWYLAAEARTPGFLQYFIVGEHWHRFVTPGWGGDRYGRAHQMAVGTIWLFAGLACLPWPLLLPWARRRGTGSRSGPPAARGWTAFVVLWSLAPLLFFTPARNIIAPYVLPALPGLALWGATWLQRQPPARADALLAGGLGLMALVLAAACLLPTARWTDAHSARQLIRADQQARRADPMDATAAAPLVFVGERPFSASFYSGGRAREMASLDALAAVAAAPTRVALPADEVQALPAHGLRVVRDLGRHGRWALLLVQAGDRESMRP